MNKEEFEFIKIIQKAIISNNMQLVKEHINIFCVFCFNGEPYNRKDIKVSNEFIEEIINILKMEKLWYMDKSYSFIMFFYNDWKRFTKNQRSRLILTFEDIFSNIIDTTSLQVLIEIISEYEANQNSFRILNKLNTTLNNERYRYLIAYGYQRLIENTHSKALQEEVFSLLYLMVKDPLEDVRIEAMGAVNSLYQQKDLQSMINSILVQNNPLK